MPRGFPSSNIYHIADQKQIAHEPSLNSKDQDDSNYLTPVPIIKPKTLFKIGLFSTQARMFYPRVVEGGGWGRWFLGIEFRAALEAQCP